MATQHKTPGVYISEPNSFPPSIVGVDTAIPAFVGYTEKAALNRKTILNTPVRIASMAEYHQIFGGRFEEKYYLQTEEPPASGGADRRIDEIALGGGKFYLMERGKKEFNLYDSMLLFYANGGGDCYVVSCGAYTDDAGAAVAIDSTKLLAALDTLSNLVGPTMLVIPDAVLLDIEPAANVAVAMLMQCAQKGDRVALLDVIEGWREDWKTEAEVSAAINAYRTALAGAPKTSLRYGMAYYPFVMTSVVQPTDVTMRNFDLDKADTLAAALTASVDAIYPPGSADGAKGESIKTNFIGRIAKDKLVEDNVVPTADQITYSQLTQGLTSNIPAFTDLLKMIATSQNMLPPSAAMAGIFTANDATAGVWNAPANVGIARVERPASTISDKQQEDMNVPAEGMAINAIRTFVNRGTLVWGARTLDGNSNDWRYIQVRRTMIYIEQSVKTALNRFVFAPNTAQTWVTVTSMIESFLHGVWAAGGLMGTSAQQAYNVQCGLGSTMTPDDILNGNMIVQIVLQMVHPAEFIELTFKQQMLGGS
jgi:phage tail sheath protein FI